uniref:Uncharacterized protein n=1 Tax=Knipowitschia caucasica TaxID=637954 RepID=A0AAV2JHJ5_KNICA
MPKTLPDQPGWTLIVAQNDPARVKPFCSGIQDHPKYEISWAKHKELFGRPLHSRLGIVQQEASFCGATILTSVLPGGGSEGRKSSTERAGLDGIAKES